jgi:hypothetical protein
MPVKIDAAPFIRMDGDRSSELVIAVASEAR